MVASSDIIGGVWLLKFLKQTRRRIFKCGWLGSAERSGGGGGGRGSRDTPFPPPHPRPRHHHYHLQSPLLPPPVITTTTTIVTSHHLQHHHHHLQSSSLSVTTTNTLGSPAHPRLYPPSPVTTISVPHPDSPTSHHHYFLFPSKSLQNRAPLHTLAFFLSCSLTSSPYKATPMAHPSTITCVSSAIFTFPHSTLTLSSPHPS